ncbi:hypothetical protein ACFX13_028671 [Malus domestica]
MATELKPQRTQNSKAVRIANISAASALRHSLPPEPPAACSKPAKSRATHPTPAYKVSLRQAASVFTLIVPKAGFVHSPDLLAGTRDDSPSVTYEFVHQCWCFVKYKNMCGKLDRRHEWGHAFGDSRPVTVTFEPFKDSPVVLKD